MEITRCPAFLAVVICLVGPWAAPAVARKTVERQTSYGTLRGFVDVVKDGQKVEKYLGVPYAKPPVGDLRFERRL